MTHDRVCVLLPIPFHGGLKGPLDYAWPYETTPPVAGTYVEVPLAGRKLIGVVWSEKARSGKLLPIEKLKPVNQVFDLPPMDQTLMDFISWVAAYTLSELGQVLKMCLTAKGAFEPLKQIKHLILAPQMPNGLKMTEARQNIIAAVDGQPPKTVQEIAAMAEVSDAAVRGLEKAGGLTPVMIRADAPFAQPSVAVIGPELSAEQTAAADALIKAVEDQSFAPFLLDGVTGAGKTEVYFEGLAAALKDKNAQVLVLVPEIALTSQWLTRFEDRFGVQPALWHSSIGQAERRRTWRAVATGEAKVVVGARSSLFLPFRDLRFIAVDEEHDPSYKQEEGVMYNARDMAVVRAKMTGCVVVMASATPSLETLVNAQGGRYGHLKLRERFGGAALPDMVGVDMRQSTLPASQWISETLKAAIKETLYRGEQVMLFLNRRGYAPLTLCRTCGHRFECASCSAWLVEHRYGSGSSRFECHHCGHVQPVPEACPSCDNEGTLAACGPGVERLYEEASEIFPDARTAIMTSDTMATPEDTKRMVEAISDGKVDLIIGTQIVTKGYHFPNLTCVGVIDADIGLRGGDMRAGERTYQQLVQVAGRAGRAQHPGTVYLQTYEPEHPVVAALLSEDTESFVSLERESREKFHMPPFGKLVALILQGEKESDVVAQGQALQSAAPRENGLEILGPAPAPMARVRGLYRYRMLLHAEKSKRVQGLVSNWIAGTRRIKGVRIKIDVDPISFM